MEALHFDDQKSEIQQIGWWKQTYLCFFFSFISNSQWASFFFGKHAGYDCSATFISNKF